jgi:hypothetical protein
MVEQDLQRWMSIVVSPFGWWGSGGGRAGEAGVVAREAAADGEVDDADDDGEEGEHEELDLEVGAAVAAADLGALLLELEGVALEPGALAHQQVDLLGPVQHLLDVLQHDPLHLRHLRLDLRHPGDLVRVRGHERHVLLQPGRELAARARARPVAEILPHALQKRERDLAPDPLARHHQVRDPAVHQKVERVAVAHIRVLAVPRRQLLQTLAGNRAKVARVRTVLRQHRRPPRHQTVNQLPIPHLKTPHNANVPQNLATATLRTPRNPNKWKLPKETKRAFPGPPHSGHS